MTTPLTPARAGDAALAALAYIEACMDDNDINKAAILNGTDLPELVVGLVTLAASLRQTLCVSLAVPETELDELLRSMFLAAGAP